MSYKIEGRTIFLLKKGTKLSFVSRKESTRIYLKVSEIERNKSNPKMMI